MNAVMAHRGPDNDSLWIDQNGQCLLGHKRLSIIDLSASANQPMVSQNGRFVLTFNGEIYNYRALRRKLENASVRLVGLGDTEVLLEWLVLHGVSGLSAVEGMFAFGLWDIQDRTLLLARDPLGIKPCYYTHKSGGYFVFASEVRAILASGLVEGRIDPASVRSYLAYGSVQAPSTICAAVQELPPAHVLRFDARSGNYTLSRFWEHKYPRLGQPSRKLSLEEFKVKFDEAVASHLVSDVPIGAFLSGGVDSSCIVASMVKSSTTEVHTLCVTLPSVGAQSDVDYARRVAKHLGTSHTEIDFSGEDVFDLVLKALTAMDQPTIDGINTFIVSKAASEAGLKVALSGLGGDELFGGYSSFTQIPHIVKQLKLLPSGGRHLAEFATSGYLRVRPFTRLGHRLHALLAAPLSTSGIYREYYRNFARTELDGLLGTRGPSQADAISPERWEELVQSCNDMDYRDAISWLELNLHMGNTMLRDTDAMSMASSLEVRVPFLDIPFVDYSQALGPQARSGGAKALLTEVFADRLPDQVFNRPKEGFFLPMDTLMLSLLRPFVEEQLAFADKELFKGRARSLWTQFTRNPAREGWKRVWSIVVLVHWCRKLDVQLTTDL